MSRWVDWHAAYDVADGPLATRLRFVQRCISDALDSAPTGPVRVVSVCAGDGRDLLGVLAQHPRARDVHGRLVELDASLAARALEAAPPGIEVHEGDASTTSAYTGAVPADIVLLCGIFGNVTDDDIVRAITTVPTLCAPGATVIWTRNRRPADRTVLARETFAAAGFEEIAFIAPDDFLFGVGMHRLVADPPPFVPDVTMFTFVGYDALEGRCNECGFVYDLERSEIIRRMTTDAAAFVVQLQAFDDAATRVRPSADVWSPLEYACHVRDVLRVQRERVELIQRESEPFMTPMRRDERVTEDQYNQQDPAFVAHTLTQRANELAAVLQQLDDSGWTRTGMYTYPTTELRTVEWIGTHTVHELQHHRHDITR